MVGSRQEVRRAREARYRQERDAALARADEGSARVLRRSLASLRARFRQVLSWRNAAESQRGNLEGIRVSPILYCVLPER